jgi:hypothetical protein
MRTVATVASLDESTPYWPVVEVNLSESPSVKVGGVTILLTGDAQAEAVAVAANRARALGYPVRMHVRSGTGVQRLVVAPNGAVVRLPDESAPAVKRRFRMSRRGAV